jgi:hypothetical protein
MDLLLGAWGTHEFSWWENDGAGNFKLWTIDPSMYGAIYIDAADLDNDGDLDVVGDLDVDIVAVAIKGDILAWWENHLDE